MFKYAAFKCQFSSENAPHMRTPRCSGTQPVGQKTSYGKGRGWRQWCSLSFMRTTVRGSEPKTDF